MIRAISTFLSANVNYFSHLSQYGSIALIGALTTVDPKYLIEYRCPTDNKLLAKGFLKDSGSMLEAKCRSCGRVSMFTGEDKEILKVRKELLKTGQIPDTE